MINKQALFLCTAFCGIPLVTKAQNGPFVDLPVHSLILVPSNEPVSSGTTLSSLGPDCLPNNGLLDSCGTAQGYNTLSGFANVLNPAYGTGQCVGTGNDQAILNEALALTGNVYIPHGANCVGTLAITGSNSTILSNGGTLTAPGGTSNFISVIGGGGTTAASDTISGLTLKENSSNATPGITFVGTTTQTITQGATSVTFSGTHTGPAMQSNMYISIRLDAGYNFFDIGTVTGNTVTWSRPLPSQSTSGSPIYATFGCIFAEGTSFLNINNIVTQNCFVPMYIGDISGNNSAQNLRLSVTNVYPVSSVGAALVQGLNTNTSVFSNYEASAGGTTASNTSGTATGGAGAPIIYNGSPIKLPYRLNLLRELSLYDNGVKLVQGTNYNVSTSDGMTINWITLPSNGDTITYSEKRYGDVGLFSYGQQGTNGGNFYIGDKFLTYEYCGYFYNTNLMKVISSVFDTCGQAAVMLDSIEGQGEIDQGSFIGWSAWAAGLQLINGAVGVNINATISFPSNSGITASGFNPTIYTSVSVDHNSGAEFYGTMYDGPGQKLIRYDNGFLTSCSQGVSNNGTPNVQTGFQWVASNTGSCNFVNTWTWAGSSEDFYINGNGSVIGFDGLSGNSFLQSGDGTLHVNANSSAGVAAILAMSAYTNIQQSINGTQVSLLNAANDLLYVPLRIVPTTVAALPNNGAVGTCPAGSVGTEYPVTDANAPSYGAALSTGGGSTGVIAYCDGVHWLSH